MSNSTPNILVISDCPSPYKVNFFKLLSRCVRLDTYFQTERLNDRNEKWYENSKEISYTILSKNPIKRFWKLLTMNISGYDLFWNLKYLSPDCIIMALKFKLHKKPILMHADGGIYKNRGFIVNKLMHIFMNLNTNFTSSGILCDDYYRYYGVDDKKILHYRFTSVLQQDVNWLKRSIKDKDLIQLLSVGQIIHRKGYDVLIKALKQCNNVKVTVVGGKVTEDLQQLIEQYQVQEKIRFIDFVTKDELRKYYQSADIFVLPTREDIWGLVINEAIAWGLPCISTNTCACLSDLNQQSSIGLMYDCEDVDALANCINQLTTDNKLYEKFNSNTEQLAHSYTMENTVKDYIEIFKKVLN